MRLKRSIGATVKEIAEEMGYSPYTVSKYTKDIAAGFLDPRNGGKPDFFR